LVVEEYLITFAGFAGFFMLLLGIMWFINASYEANRRKSWRKLTGVDDWDFDITKILRLMTYYGFIVGILCILAGAIGLILNVPPSIAYAATTGNERNIFTSIFLIIFGFFAFMKPLNDLPISSMVGLFVATAVTLVIAFLIPDSAVELIGEFVNPKIVLIVIFFIIFTVVAITVKFYTAGLMAASKFISWMPIAFIVSVVSFIQAFMLLVLGLSLF
jgi:hypothetical protein